MPARRKPWSSRITARHELPLAAVRVAVADANAQLPEKERLRPGWDARHTAIDSVDGRLHLRAIAVEAGVTEISIECRAVRRAGKSDPHSLKPMFAAQERVSRLMRAISRHVEVAQSKAAMEAVDARIAATLEKIDGRIAAALERSGPRSDAPTPGVPAVIEVPTAQARRLRPYQHISPLLRSRGERDLV